MPGVMELSTPITELSLSSSEQSVLTETAKTLTKGDLLTIARLQTKGPVTVQDIDQALGKGLTITDLISVANAYGGQADQRLAGAPEALASACCCCTCTPCCSCSCANVVIEPVIA